MKQIKYLFVMVIATFIFVACQKPHCAPIPLRQFYLKIVDAEGNNLVGTPLYGDSIKAYRNNGEQVSYHVYDKEVRVDIGVSLDRNEKTVTTYIKWNTKDVDTIVSTTGLFGGFYTYDKVYYNDSLVISSYKQVVEPSNPNYTGQRITIVK
ncbi:hypothetical protein HW49_10925 [Porphyromonadaceae bacterium COT-184 OH4590]|nr:hypothetical protein HW49_10925 [Porphyromonadaceae bacterium COT-184 OH4590]